MPRIYDSASDAHDFCKFCIPKEAKAIELFGNVGDGPDGRGNCFEYEALHPEYGQDDRDLCETCNKELTERDA